MIVIRKNECFCKTSWFVIFWHIVFWKEPIEILSISLILNFFTNVEDNEGVKGEKEKFL